MLEANGVVVERVVEWGFPFYSPLYRDLFRVTGVKAAEGTYGPGRRMLAALLYQIFRLNAWNRGDYVAVLARRP